MIHTIRKVRSNMIEEIRQAIRREPFKPFSIKLKSGKMIRVTRIGYLAIGWGFIVRTSPLHNKTRYYQEDEIESVQSIEPAVH